MGAPGTLGRPWVTFARTGVTAQRELGAVGDSARTPSFPGVLERGAGGGQLLFRM